MSSLHLLPLRDGFVPPDMTDVLCADKAIWNFMERTCPDHIRPATAAPGAAVASFPLVTAMEAALNEPEVKDFLKCQPAHLKGNSKPNANSAAAALKAPGGKAPASGASKEAKKVKKKEKKAKAKAKAKAAAKRLAKLEQQVAKGGGKGKTKTTGNAERGPKIPRGLLPNGRAKAIDGSSFCFGYNLGSCTHADVQPKKIN